MTVQYRVLISDLAGPLYKVENPGRPFPSVSQKFNKKGVRIGLPRCSFIRKSSKKRDSEQLNSKRNSNCSLSLFSRYPILKQAKPEYDALPK